MKILFVCSGNICRSPMAAEYLRHRAAAAGLHHLVADSAGLLGIRGAPASPESIRVLAEEEHLDLRAHRSRGVDEVDLRTSDLVIGMTLQHMEELDARFPGSHGRCLLLRAFESSTEPLAGAPDLEDPIGRPLDFYRECFTQIRDSVDHLVLHLDRP